MDQLSIVGLVKALEKSFDHCNAEYFGGLVDRPVITIAQGAKARAYGWVSVKPVWHEIEGEKQAHELNISSEYLKQKKRKNQSKNQPGGSGYNERYLYEQ